jgi:S1-C subfamily serine protease
MGNPGLFDAKSRIQGTSTTYIPVTTHRHQYSAAFFAKMKTNIGLNFRPLNEEERQALQTNQAVVVAVVVDDSRAFYADFLEGDVVVAVDGVKVAGMTGFRSLMESKRGTEVTFNILRKGQPINKVLNLAQ